MPDRFRKLSWICRKLNEGIFVRKVITRLWNMGVKKAGRVGDNKLTPGAVSTSVTISIWRALWEISSEIISPFRLISTWHPLARGSAPYIQHYAVFIVLINFGWSGSYTHFAGYHLFQISWKSQQHTSRRTLHIPSWLWTPSRLQVPSSSATTIVVATIFLRGNCCHKLWPKTRPFCVGLFVR